METIMLQSVQMKVNERNLVKHLRLTFSRNTTVLGELLQNGRRAKATCIRITQDPRPDNHDLTIEDDGEGIDDFGKLLRVAESGWDVETIERESAYGLGFCSSLFSADRIVVESSGMKLEADTADILAFRPLPLTPCETRPGTRITLVGFRLEDTDEVDAELRRFARGFPIPVFWNNEELERPHAVNGSLGFMETPVGLAAIQDIDSAKDNRYGEVVHPSGCRHNLTLYLQGLPVYESRYIGAGRNIVHLDPKQFFGRLPDRDKLIDENDQVDRVTGTIKGIWREALTKARETVPAEEYVENYYQTLKKWGCLDLLNTVDVIPRQALELVTDYPIIRSAWGDSVYSTYKGPLVTSADLDTGKVRIFTMGTMQEGYGDAQAEMYAWLTKLVLAEKKGLDEKHWMWNHVQEITDRDLTVVVPDPIAEGQYQGNRVRGDVMLVNSYEIHGPVGPVTGHQHGFSMYGQLTVGGSTIESGVSVMIIPRQDTSADVLRQVTTFVFEDNYEEIAETEEKDSFSRFIRSLDPRNAADVLQDILNEARLSRYQNLAGKLFEIRITEKGVTAKQLTQRKKKR